MTKPVVAWRGNTPRVVNSSAYHGAAQTTRTRSWYAPSSGPNATLQHSLGTLRNRSKEAQRNNPLISKALNSLAVSEVGTGITPRFRTRNIAVREMLQGLWPLFVNQIDPDGVLNFYGMQMLATFNRNMSGEIFLRRIRQSFSEGFAVPLQVQALEAEFVPETLNQLLPNGNRIVAGIEFNPKGHRAAYWMYREHPGEYMLSVNMGDLIRIPACDVIHHYKATIARPGQKRGVPRAAQSLLKAKDYDDYDDAELKRKKTRAPYTGMLYREPMQGDYLYDPITGQKLESTQTGEPAAPMNVQAGTILVGELGERLDLFDGDNTGQGYADYQWLQKLAVSAGLDVPYEHSTGDWSKVNDRLVRAINNEYHRQIEADQDHLLKFQVCDGVAKWFIEAAYMAGYDLPDYAINYHDYLNIDWQAQPFKYLHPVQDVQARKMKIEAGLSSRQQELNKEGTNVEEIDRQNAEDEARVIAERKAAGLLDAPKSKGNSIEEGQDTTEDEVGDEDDLDLEDFKKRTDAYAISVRSGAITPQPEDEESFRRDGGFPVMSEKVKAAWEDDGGVRRPITLRSGKAFEAEQTQIAEEGEQ